MAYEFKGGEGLWQEYVNTDTKESSIALHTPREIQIFCKPSDHNFKQINSTSREVVCSKCGIISNYILGLQKLQDGKIIDIIKPTVG